MVLIRDGDEASRRECAAVGWGSQTSTSRSKKRCPTLRDFCPESRYPHLRVIRGAWLL